MKKIFLLILISSNALFVCAQKTDSLQKNQGKIRNVDGALMSPSKDIIDNISASTEFTTLLNAMKVAGVADIFKGGPITVFAPINKAFEKLPSGKIDTLLLPAHTAELANLLKYHAIAGRITSKDIEAQIKAGNGQATLTTLAGGVLIATINANRNIVLTDEMGGQSVISKFDIAPSNGILNVVTAVLSPKTTL